MRNWCTIMSFLVVVCRRALFTVFTPFHPCRTQKYSQNRTRSYILKIYDRSQKKTLEHYNFNEFFKAFRKSARKTNLCFSWGTNNSKKLQCQSVKLVKLSFFCYQMWPGCCLSPRWVADRSAVQWRGCRYCPGKLPLAGLGCPVPTQCQCTLYT